MKRVVEPEHERAATAFYELLGGVRRLQKSSLLAPRVSALILGFVGTAAHATGYWSVIGVTPQGYYYVPPR